MGMGSIILIPVFSSPISGRESREQLVYLIVRPQLPPGILSLRVRKVRKLTF
jgi:hypothetical protein